MQIHFFSNKAFSWPAYPEAGLGNVYNQCLNKNRNIAHIAVYNTNVNLSQ